TSIVALGGRALGVIAVADPPRVHAADAVRALGALGVRAEMLSGDNAVVGNKIAAELGIGGCIPVHGPDERLVAIRGLEGKGRRVGVVGATLTTDVGVGILLGGNPHRVGAARLVLGPLDPPPAPTPAHIARRTLPTLRP